MYSVFKFGGAALKDSGGIRNVEKIIFQQGKPNQLLVVVSAMGKTTDLLVEILQRYSKNLSIVEYFEKLKKYHEQAIQALFPTYAASIMPTLDKLLADLRGEMGKSYTDYRCWYDQCVGYGEIISSHILYAYLLSKGHSVDLIDSRRYIQTNDQWSEAAVDWAWSEDLMIADLPEILEQKIIVTQGFIGSTVGGKTTTLGREGSDFTAAIYASCLKAESVTIWKDVPGILSADPRRTDEWKLYERLNYREAAEMSYYGATVIHPKTVRPLTLKKIPLYVKSFLSPENSGTCIGDFPEEDPQSAIIFKGKQSLLRFEEKDFSNINRANMGHALALLSRMNIHINLMRVSAVSFSICTTTDLEKFAQVQKKLLKHFDIRLVHDLELLTIKNYTPELIAKYTQEGEMYWEERSKRNYQQLRKM